MRKTEKKSPKATLLLATNNEGKIKEYKEIFRQLGLAIQTISLKELGITEKFEENGTSFEENAGEKARFYCKLSGMPTLADDGGLEIDYLNGEPGVLSRRWPGYEATDEELRHMVFEKLKGVPKEKRGAQLRVAIAITKDCERIYIFQSTLRGYIVEDEREAGRLLEGYPFRSLIYLPEQNIVLSKLRFEEEVKLGHRIKALREAEPFLKQFVSNTNWYGRS